MRSYRAKPFHIRPSFLRIAEPAIKVYSDCAPAYDGKRQESSADLIGRLKKLDWLAKETQSCKVDELVDLAFADDPEALMKGSHLVNSIEYFRAVHAEMAAIVDAARRGDTGRNPIHALRFLPESE